MNPDFKVRNDSPSGPLHLAHSTNKLWSFAYVTHSLLRELPVSNILHRSIGPLCLPACSHADAPLLTSSTLQWLPKYGYQDYWRQTAHKSVGKSPKLVFHTSLELRLLLIIANTALTQSLREPGKLLPVYTARRSLEALQSHRWMLHPNPHSLLRLAWTSWVGKSITVLLSARNSHPGFCLLLALLGRHHTKKPISLWRRLFGSASRCSTVVASGWMKSVLRTTSLIAPRDMPAIY